MDFLLRDTGFYGFLENEGGGFEGEEGEVKEFGCVGLVPVEYFEDCYDDGAFG